MKLDLRGADFMICFEICVSGVWISGFGLKCKFQGFGFQDLRRNAGFKGMDFTIWVEMLLSMVWISRFGSKSWFQG